MALELVQNVVEPCYLQDLETFQSFVFANKDVSQERLVLLSTYIDDDMLLTCMSGDGVLYRFNMNTKVVPGPMVKSVSFPV